MYAFKGRRNGYWITGLEGLAVRFSAANSARMASPQESPSSSGAALDREKSHVFAMAEKRVLRTNDCCTWGVGVAGADAWPSREAVSVHGDAIGIWQRSATSVKVLQALCFACFYNRERCACIQTMKCWCWKAGNYADALTVCVCVCNL